MAPHHFFFKSEQPHKHHTDAATLWPVTNAFLPDELLATIAGEAATADEQGLLSQAIIERLRAPGYFAMPIPLELNGGGAGLLECAAAQRRLGMADPALAIAVNMHLFSVGMAAEHWRRRRDTCGLLLEAIAAQNRIVSSAFAEPGLGGLLLRSTTKARRAAGGYRVNGVKSPCSLAGVCDLICFQMQTEPSEPDGLIMALIPAKTPGVRFIQTWDSLGMRASGSDTLVFEECFVPDELIFHRSEPANDADEVFAAGLVWFAIMTTATYFGVVQATLDAVCGELHRALVAHLGAPRAQLPSVQGQLGEIVATVVAHEAACVGIAERFDSHRDDPRDLLPLALAVKHVAMDGCVRAVELAAELAGGKSYARDAPIARFWRDVQAVRYHPPTRLAARQILGKWRLGLPFSLELDETPTVGSQESAK